jgi:hypothetical protein
VKLLITTIAACVGMAVSAVYLLMFMPRPGQGLGRDAEELHFLETFAIMLVVAGRVGQLLYRLAGLDRDAAIAQRETAAHARVLQIVAAVILLGSAFFTWRANGQFPAVDWVPVLVGLAVLADVWIQWYFERSNPELARVSVECPVCRCASESMKLYRIFDRFVFFGVLVVREREEVACPSCMRSILWGRCFANLFTANLLWPVWVLPRTLIMVAATYSRGHSRGIEV